MLKTILAGSTGFALMLALAFHYDLTQGRQLDPQGRAQFYSWVLHWMALPSGLVTGGAYALGQRQVSTKVMARRLQITPGLQGNTELMVGLGVLLSKEVD